MNTDTSLDRPRHPIKVVARRTGLSPDVIRAWEKRYEAVVPQRTPTGHRLYSDADLERLLLLSRVVEAGRRIGDVAGLSLDRLHGLAAEDEEARQRAPMTSRTAPRGGESAADFLGRALLAVEALDGQALDETLQGATVSLSGPVLRRDLLLPLMHRVGEGWRRGTLRIAHEHLASAIVRSFLGTIRGTANLSPSAPRLLVTTPAGQAHELGALIVASGAAESGWRVTYLGPNLPAEEIAAVAREQRVRAVALSLVYPPDDPQVHMELQKLRRLLGDEVTVFVGGTEAASYAKTLNEIHAVRAKDLDDFQTRLEALART